MDELLLRYLHGGTTRSEQDRVIAYLQKSPQHRAHLEELQEVFALARSLDLRTDPGPPPRATDLVKQAEQGEPDVVRVRRRRRVWITAPLAAAAMAALVILGAVMYGPLPLGSDAAPLAAEELMTGAGESTTIRMSDGTVVRLGPNSRLQVMPEGSGRQVVLVGRAFFAVASNEKRPFRVHTPEGSVRVLGTRFQLEAGVQDMRLVVVEGSVALTSSGSEVEVGAGQMTRVTSGRVEAVQIAPGLAELASEWMGQFLVFQGTPLSRAAREIAEVYDVEVRILDAALGDKTLTLWLSSRPLEDVLAVVCSVVDASCEISGGVVAMEPRRH